MLVAEHASAGDVELYTNKTTLREIGVIAARHDVLKGVDGSCRILPDAQSEQVVTVGSQKSMKLTIGMTQHPHAQKERWLPSKEAEDGGKKILEDLACVGQAVDGLAEDPEKLPMVWVVGRGDGSEGGRSGGNGACRYTCTTSAF
uniref:Uncharacterized protein n=1 Tax=Chromera velia CCMP2878 TaxID=1169474 RepID=A0A0G4F222_9ALVE|eukprot:Cvel_14688.t1-p1 / transcript=Cvel_14688.t1 / gene=Cvel_14688 / organism=Chromera_velia_CCMP2878 / gene_product=hypothetical protein / transcript_product=hypothetical protein / location=Cvel_scaffold1054:7125-7556(+) / protein_length=144 / sequence_SO=supercontig / SO=protein_coding / is_pseudo=false